MTTRDLAEERIVELCAKVLGAEPGTISATTAFEADLGAKSGNLTMIITQLEDEFDVEIPYLDFKRAATVGAAAEVIAGLCDE